MSTLALPKKNEVGVDGGAPEATRPLLLRVQEVAELLRLDRATIYRMLRSGELRSVKRGSARRVIYESVVMWIAQSEAAQREV